MSEATVPSDSDTTLPQLAVRGDDAARLCGVSPRLWRALDSSGRCPRGTRLGRAKVWVVGELQAWLAAGAPSRDRWETMRAHDT